MRPLRLELYNFLAYHKPAPISFDGLHVACLSGQNGAGKSSLLDAITWVLWKRARARDDDKLLRMGQNEMYVVFDFRQDENLYRVRRSYTRRGRTGQSALDLFGWTGEYWQPISEAQSIAEKQREITKLLRLDYETFVHSAFVQQGKADAFTIQPPSRRKEILADILGLSIWESYENRAKARIQAIEKEIAGVQASLDAIAAEEAREPELRRACEAADQQYHAAREAMAAAEADYAQYADVEPALKAAEAQHQAETRRLAPLRKSLAALEAEIASKQSKRDKYARVAANRAQIEAGYAQLERQREIVKALDEMFRRKSEIEKQRSAQANQLAVLRAQLETQLREIAKRLNAAQQEAAQVEKIAAQLAETQAAVAELDARKAERDLIQAEQQRDAEQVTALRERNQALRTEIDDLKRRLDMLASSDAPQCPVCGQPLNDEQRANVSAQYADEGKQRANAYRDNDRAIKHIAAEMKRRDALLAEIERALRQYDALKKREGGLHEQLNKAQQALQRANEEQAALDEVRQILADESFGVEHRAQIAQCDAALADLGYDDDAHDAARQRLTVLEGYTRQQHELEMALQELPELETEIAHKTAQHQEQTAELVACEAQVAELDVQIAALSARAEAARARKAEVDRLRREERKASEDLIIAQQSLNAIESARQRRPVLLAQRERFQQEAAIYAELQQAFGKKGVPAMLIEAAVPELEELANDLLTRMTDGRMHLRFDTQRAKKTGRPDEAIETLDILISDELGTRDYDLFSGGEGFRVNFALRIALSQLLARRAGARLQTLVIDEGFGSQDSAGRERLVEAINAISNDFDLILIVTHIEELRDVFPAQIEVHKTPSGSELVVR